ncbi:MAG: hypothetical protein COA43_01100 [Robiginitomaculum sp.]|nr:MAG: hypothetical protein COA43_01100 [Robiginitomaculum sp.]
MTHSPPLAKRRAIRVGEMQEIIAHHPDGAVSQKGILAWLSTPDRQQTKQWCIDWLNQFGRCEGECKRLLSKCISFDFDHTIPNALQYEGDEIKWQILCSELCHPKKTKQDVKDIARAKRRKGETGQYARRKKRGGSLIQSRGFNTGLTKGFDGVVRSRT